MPVCTHGFRPQEGFEDYCECGSHRAHHVVLPPEKSTPPKPAHIDTTAPEVSYAPTPSPIDTTGQEMKQLGPLNARDQSAIDAGCNCDRRMSYMDWSHANTCPLHFEPAPSPIATTQGDEKVRAESQIGAQFGLSVKQTDAFLATLLTHGFELTQPKPAPQAEAQESFEEWFTDERADKYQYGAEGPARDAWNAQQAKIEALEQRVVELENLFGLPDENDPLCARLVNSGTFDPEVQRARSGGSIGDWMRRAETAESRVAELEEKLREGK